MRAFRIAYDGRPFHGFQRQPDVPTVEDAIFAALGDLDVTAGGDPPGYSAAGRTDAGVSALAQTVALEAPEWLSPRALNAELPETIRAWAAADVAGDFHATRDAKRRTYRYFLYGPSLADDRVRAALDRLAGEHDFHNLTPDDRGTVRTIAGDVVRDGPYLIFTLAAGGFARQLVRRIVSLLRSVGSGAPLETVDRTLGPAPLEGPDGIAPAPAYPLVLASVAYDCDFAVEPAAAREAASIFRDRATEDRTRSRVASAIAAGIDRDRDAAGIDRDRDATGSR